MSLIAFRHAKVASAGICYGQLEIAVELLDEEAAAIVEGQLHGVAVDRVWSSPLARCAGPARLLARRFGVPHVIDARLCEIAYGAWEGQAWEAIEREDGAAYVSWTNAWKTSGPPGGESAIDVERRVRAWWEELQRGATEVLVAHAGVMRALAVITRGLPWEKAMAAPIDHLRKKLFPGPRIP